MIKGIVVPKRLGTAETGGSAVKNPPANAGDLGSIPGLDISPGKANGNSIQYSCLGIPWTEKPGGL